MEVLDSAVTQYYELEPRRFSALSSFLLRRDAAGASDLVIELGASRGEPDILRLVFRRVTQLNISSEGDLSELSFLDVVSLRESGWESINYRVYHAEQDLDLSFYCSDFSAEVYALSTVSTNVFAVAGGGNALTVAQN